MARVPFRISRATFASLVFLAGAMLASCRPAADQGPPTPDFRLRIRTQPQNAAAGAPIGTPAIVEVIDPDEELVTETNLAMRASISAGFAQISAGGLVPVVNGVATFNEMEITGPVGANVRITFTLIVNDVTDPTTAVGAEIFTLKVGPPRSVSPASAVAYVGAPGDVASPSPSVVVRDVSSNPVPGANVTFTITSGEGRITGPATVTTDAEGVATVGGWVLGLPGDNRLLATTQTTQDVTFRASVTAPAGMLRIRLEGTPNGSSAKVRVVKTSAAGTVYDVIHTISDSLTVTGLPFGTYQVSGDSVKVGARIWQADGAAGNLVVATDKAPSISLSYREYGRFQITARGLPSANQTAIVDFQPTAGDFALAFSQTVLNDAVTRGLGPIGTYDVVPRTVSAAGQQFSGTPPKQSVVLANGNTVSPITIDYIVTTGTLKVTLEGDLPAGAAPQIDVTGPGGFHETVFMSGTRTWTGLVPGTYTVVASPITVGGVQFKPNPASSNNAVTAGNETTRTITYN